MDGLLELLRAENTVGSKVDGVLSDALYQVAEQTIAPEVRSRYKSYSQAGADGVETKVFTSGVWVVQTLRKSRAMSRRRPSFGPLMMEKAFIPSVNHNRAWVVAGVKHAIGMLGALYWDKA